MKLYPRKCKFYLRDWIRFIFSLLLCSVLALILNELVFMNNDKFNEKETFKGSVSQILGSSNNFLNMMTLEQKMFPDFSNCVTKKLERKYVQHGRFWVLQNYIKATEEFQCNESITYTTLGELGYLHSLVEVTRRWQGPVSVAVLAAGTSFMKTVDAIYHLRECVSKDVKKFVTFHMFFEAIHFPDKVPNEKELLNYRVNCSRDLRDLDSSNEYRHEHKLPFPINIARNIAWSNSATYFIFPSDIELYPSLNIIQEFFKLLGRPDVSNTTNKRVYVLPHFELAAHQVPPESKQEIVTLLQKKKAFVFHENQCKQCHEIPHYHKWVNEEVKPGLSVLGIGKRKKEHIKLEPFFITTTELPFFDERFMSEGIGDKMVQNYIMCLMDYEYHVLDNAFLVHEPILKKKDTHNLDLISKQMAMRQTVIKKECDIFFGIDEECVM